MQLTRQHTHCPICNSSSFKKLKGYYSHKGMIKCLSCKLFFMERIPTDEELYHHYSDYPYVFPLAVRQSIDDNYSRLLERIEPFRRTGRLLEFGCGTGLFLKKAKEKNWQATGIELSEKALRECRAQNLEVYPSVLELPEELKESVDVVVSIEVIEHLRDFNDYMKQIHLLLRKGGVFYCTTPNFNNPARFRHKEAYHIIEYPEHLLYFTCKSLDFAMKQAGFVTYHLRTTGIDFSSKRDYCDINNADAADLTSNEMLMAKTGRTLFTRILKGFVNRGLTFFRIGMTIKAFYIKKG